MKVEITRENLRFVSIKQNENEAKYLIGAAIISFLPNSSNL